MLTIWGRNTSSNVQKVMWALGELNVECERIDIGGPFGGNREVSYLALNPNGLIPTFVDGDLVLWESNAILRHLLRRHGGVLQPTGPNALALADQWLDWQLSVVAPVQMPVFIGLVRTPPDQRDLGAIAAAAVKLTGVMQILDAHLGSTPFVVGPQFSVADIPLGVMAYRFRELVSDRPALPNFERWYAAIAQRASFRKNVGSILLT